MSNETINDTIDADCCTGNLDPNNPRSTYRKKNRKAKFIKLAEIENPIPNEVSDPSELKMFFDKFPFIPYAGNSRTTSHSLLCHMINFLQLSVTKSAVVQSIKSWSFGSKIDIVKSTDTDFDLGEDIYNIDIADKRRYHEAIKQNVYLGDDTLKGQACKMSESYDLTGNIYVELIRTETAGQRMFTAQFHSALDVLYLYTKPGQTKIVGVSKKWTEDHLKKNPPTLIPVFPTFHQFEDGTQRSMIHVKEGNFDWYGRPPDFSSFIDQYNEYKLREFLTKQINTNFIGQVLIEIEDDEPTGNDFDEDGNMKAGFEGTADRLEENFTNKGGDPTSVVAMTRPAGSDHAFIHEFKPNTSEKFICKISAELRGNIIGANDWSEALLRKDQTSGFNSQMFKDVFTIVNATKINARQILIEKIQNTIINEAFEWMGISEFKEFAIKYQTPLKKLIDETIENPTL